ncbi:MAG TPA: Ig-like domain-containing protein [Candidatus Dormibacteraeota bacterium]
MGDIAGGSLRRAVTLVAAVALLAGIGTFAVNAGTGTAVVRGQSLYTRIFPDNFFLTRDRTQLTGHRVNLVQGRDFPRYQGQIQPGCTTADYSLCDAAAELNTLDGFDLQPRVTVPFTGPIDLSSVTVDDFYITGANGFKSGLRQLTFDPTSNILAGIADAFLQEDTTYVIHVTNGIRDTSGKSVSACSGGCTATFTTRTASSELVKIRKSLDSGLAYSQAGIANKGITFDGVFNTAMLGPSLSGQLPQNSIVRIDQVNVNGATQSSAVPVLIPPGSAGYFAFGSFLSPRYQYASSTGHQDDPNGFTDGQIPVVGTTQTPAALGADRIRAIVVTPDPNRFPPPWPAAIYGPGFTRSAYDIFVTADYNASLGILTVATDPSGHGFGPQSKTQVTTIDGTTTTFSSHGRGRDLEGDGLIGDGLNDGVGPTGHCTTTACTTELPSRKPLDGLESGLVQTTVDNMALARSLTSGLTIAGIGSNLVKGNPMYYGLSFGGIYGTMLTGTDPLIHQALMNVPGGPIADIARESGFRADVAAALGRTKPSELNGGPGLNGFTEDLPLRSDAPEVISHAGAFALQETFGDTDWYDRMGSPETFAPRIRLRPDLAWATNPKNVLFESAYGDGTVPNPTAGVLYRAGDLFDRVLYYRNDKTPTYSSDPHGWLADPTLSGRTSGEQLLGIFLSTGQVVNTNPAWFEFPVANPGNFECLHYGDPSLGQQPNRQPFPASGDCPALSADG